MTLFYSDVFVLPLPSHHRFPMGKYVRLRERLLAGGDFAEGDFRVPEAASDAEITRAHCPRYLERVQAGQLDASEIRAIGFPWSERMVERSRRSSGATLAAAREALARGWSANLAGGTHHAGSEIPASRGGRNAPGTVVAVRRGGRAPAKAARRPHGSSER